MTDDLRPPYRIQFDNARDPYTARNALGITGTGGSGGGAPVDAQYIVAVDDPTLTNDRVLTNTATVTWDLTTPGQVKANAVTGGNVSNSGTPTSGQYAKWVTATTIQGVAPATVLSDIGAQPAGSYQPLDADLTSLAAAAATNAIYYRSAANTWGPVTVGSGLTFTGGTLDAAAGTGVTKVVPQVITATSAYTPTSGMKYAILEMVAPGGGGGGISASAAGSVLGGGGGGSGSYARSAISAATAALGVTVTLGAAGGAGAAGANGGPGGFSSVTGPAVTISIASPAVITLTNHGLRIGQAMGFSSSGTLPTGITSLARYFVIAAGFGANSFQISATFGGSAVNTSGSQSGTHSIYYLTCNGGTGGTGTVGVSTYPIAGGAGAAGIGDFVMQGTPGWFGFYSTILGPAGPSGAGAPSYFGGGGAQVMAAGSSGSNGNGGIGFGAGGSGGIINNGTGSVTGGAGAAGVCVITEFCSQEISMALTYADTAALMTNQEFIGRTRIACLHYASYISGEDYTVPAYNTRQRWSGATFQNPDAATLAVMPVLVMDDKVQVAGAAITDADLQSALETSVNKMF